MIRVGKWILILLSGLCIAAGKTPAPDSVRTSPPIIAIDIEGNRITKESIILREMKSKIGEPLDSDLLREDEKRIMNLALFNRVEADTEETSAGVRIRIQVTEKWYWFPYPILFFTDRDWNKVSYGAGLSYSNFRGRAETLNGLFWLGTNPAVQVTYTNPWLGGVRQLTGSASGWVQRIRSRHFEDCDENQAGGFLSLGRRFGYHTHAGITLGYKQVSLEPAQSGGTLSEDGTDRLPSLGLSFQWDRRDLKEYPRSGALLIFWASKTGLPGGTVDFIRYGFDVRGYLPVGRPTLAGRFTAELSAGELPVYDRVYLGTQERVRGHFFEKQEGENLAVAALAFRIPLLPLRYFHVASLPQLRNLKFGVSLGLFADAGLVWFQDEHPDLSKILAGYGLGIHFNLPYIDVFRLELALNESGRAEVIADLFVDI